MGLQTRREGSGDLCPPDAPEVGFVFHGTVKSGRIADVIEMPKIEEKITGIAAKIDWYGAATRDEKPPPHTPEVASIGATS